MTPTLRGDDVRQRLPAARGPGHERCDCPRLSRQHAPSDSAKGRWARQVAARRTARAWVIEVAARSIGGLCSRTLEFGTGMSLESLILAHALGRPVESLHRTHTGVLMLPIRSGGTLVAIDGREKSCRCGSWRRSELPASLFLPEGNRYLGFVFARGESPAEVVASLRGRAQHAEEPEAVHEPGGRTAIPRALRRSFASLIVWRPKWKIEEASRPSACPTRTRCSSLPTPPLAITGTDTESVNPACQLEVVAASVPSRIHRSDKDLSRGSRRMCVPSSVRVDRRLAPAVGEHLPVVLARSFHPSIATTMH